MNTKAYITGMGICSPIGIELSEVIAALQEGRSGIAEIQSFDCSSMTMKHAGEVKHIPVPERVTKELYQTWDRGTRMAVYAAGKAIDDAALNISNSRADRIGVCIGTSGSGQYQNARFQLDRSLKLDPELMFFLSRNSPHYQSSQVAAYYGIKGPNLAIGAATAGSGIAISVALSWLASDRADLVLVGGSESFSLLNVLGFDQLGLSKPEPCTPYSGQPGMTFGEGAGFIVLESEANALRRNARSHAQLSGIGVRADGFDSILFDPSGDGQRRAIQAALQAADRSPEDIDWIRASGTGGRDQDLAETLAIKAVFSNPPPVSSLEPFYGHANGAGPAIGVVAAILCMKHGLIPQTIGFGEARPGCDIDYVTSASRHSPLNDVLCNTAAFGGVNTAILLSSTSLPECPEVATHPVHGGHGLDGDCDDVVITGLGIVSARGCGNREVVDRLDSTLQSLTRDERLAGTDLESTEVGMVQHFNPRLYCPTIKLRGLEFLTQYAAASVALAIKDAKLEKEHWNAERIGVASGITRSSGAVFERLFSELGNNGFRPMVGKLMLRNGRFMIASQLAHWFDMRGYTSTVCLGVGCGLHALLSAHDQLRNDPQLDAIVVLATDELSPFSLRGMDIGGLLARNSANWNLYGQSNSSIVPGEGSVAVVLERKRFAQRRGAVPLARIAGSALSFDGLAGASRMIPHQRPNWEAVDGTGQVLLENLRRASEQADLSPESIDVVFGNGTGISEWDAKESLALSQFFKNPPPFACVNGHFGLCESASGLFNLASAISVINRGILPQCPHMDRSPLKSLRNPTEYRNALITTSSEHGHNASVVIEREA